MESNQLLEDEHHGFWSGKSVITARIEFVQTVIDKIDKGEKVLGVFLDMSKAFDSVPHIKLIYVLKSLNIGTNERAWFTWSYLNNRRQLVEILHSIKGRYIWLSNVSSLVESVQFVVPQKFHSGTCFICLLSKRIPGVVQELGYILYVCR